LPAWLLLAVVVVVAVSIVVGATLGHAVVSSTIAILLGLLLCIPYLLDHPFGTHRGITPETFERSVEVFDAVDRGT
jgi:ABC-type Co2+ transport system permease subunit